MFCTSCGKKLPENSLDCSYCGNRIILPKENYIENNDGQASKKDCTKKDEINCIEHNLNLKKLVKNEQQQIFERNQKLALQSRKFKPLGTGSFFLIDFCIMIPIVNLILLFVWSFKKNINANKKAFARSVLIWILIFLIINAIVLLIMTIMQYPMNISYWFNELKYSINNIDL